MIRSARRLLLATAGAVILTGLPAMASAQDVAPAWPQATSDLPADEAVRFGTLPNGMRYALMANDTPPGQASLRLRIDAGSLHEGEDQLGLAHFTEHMLFNGTEEIPENDLLRILERRGLAFGADTNATTSFDQTFYRLDLPQTDDGTVDDALRILRQQVSSALMDPAAIDAERNVIVGEERTRNTPQLRSAIAQFGLLAEGQRLADRMPIGDLDIIRNAPAERFVAFYDAYYRPSRTTLIAVGDFDLDAMEAKIRDQFGDWTPRAADGPEPDLGQIADRDAETAILVEPGVVSNVQINWVRPPDLDPDSASERREDLIPALGLAVLSRRLGEMARADDPPFIQAGASTAGLFDTLELTTVLAVFNEGQHARAIQTLEQEQRRLTQYGVSQTELDREITEVRTALENAVATAPTRTTPGLANALLSNVNEDTVFTTPQTNLDQFNAAVDGLTAETVNAALPAVFAGEGPLTLIVSPVAIPEGEDGITQIIEASRQTPVEARADQADLQWPYAEFGAPGQVTDQREIAEIGATVVTFDNGSTLTVKPTDYREDQILVALRTGRGELAMPADQQSVLAIGSGVLTAGGLGQLTADDLERVLSGRVYSSGFSIGSDAFEFSGATRPEDLGLQMQVLTAYLTDPGVRPAPFEQIKAIFPQIIAQSSATPQGVFSLRSPELLASGDQRAAIPSAETLQSWNNDQLKAAITEALATGAVHVTMVGDVTVEDAIAATASTVGALPQRAAAPEPTATSAVRRFPQPVSEPVQLTHTGPAEQALAYVAWPATDAVTDHTEARTIDMLHRVMTLRALEEIRERQALTYSPSVDFSASQTFEDYGLISMAGLVTPENIQPFFAAAEAIAADLAANPIDQDELDRARRPEVEAQRQAQAGNAWWLSELSDIVEKPGDVGQITTAISDLEAVTPADIQAAAQRYLRPDTAWKATVVSENPPSTATPAPAAQPAGS
ncbi:M16 family metallopeptidase [Brevundimonas lutea]|uniref:M16 family metallopeptidase n=1 Tax=Brevundimonas lutea TaxID=2293980 RepID=UPI00196A2CE7|nr:M16 family metallopeptidase [Brevundimonas lutea]